MPPAVIENASYDPANPSRIGRRMFSIHPLIYNSNTAIIDGGSAGVSLKANSIPFWTLASRFEVTIRKEHPKKKSHWANLESSVVSTAVRAFANIQSEHKSPEQDVSPTIPTPLLEVAGAEKQFAISKRLEHLSSQITTSHRLSLPPLSMGMRCGWSGKTFHFGLGGASTRAEQFWLIHLQCWFNLSCVDSKRLLLIFLFFFLAQLKN